MGPPGRPLTVPYILLVLLFYIASIQHHHGTLANTITQEHLFTIPFDNDAAFVMAAGTPATTTVTVSTTPSSRSPAQSTASTSPLPRRCKNCPPNNTLGQICYKNTQCVPLALLCNTTTSPTTNITTGTNPCVDATGPVPLHADNSITCRDQLCFANTFLPLPAPGSGKVNRNSSANCLKGSYFSLYGSLLTGEKRYTQSCVGQFPTGQIVTCNPWEYQAQGSCFLRTCGPGMDCEPPFLCRRPSSSIELYGLCMSPNSTADPTGDDSGDQDSPSVKDHLLIGLLVGICSLVLGIGIGTGCWNLRKRRLKQLRLMNGELDNNTTMMNGKTFFLTTLGQCYDACCCFGSARRQTRGQRADAGALTIGEARDIRVISVAESESHESSLVANHQTNLIFARRWRWGQGGQHGAGIWRGTTAGGVAAVPELEPPPLYHQGLGLPSYRGRDTILLTPVPELMAQASNPSVAAERSRSPTPK
ncbi:hypothetical protein BC939DRAFT_456318 [Gamsiella multidivaricata]|uniref:uncharacterized protein n=1 Tax=Gamsiella multidivaricata TaxID=101098 RepID=UPI00221EF045|nr:uncharacterized protein BC939DRAFT_456318 [Gamsiella multidivaricata]KAI7821029.1 hypothetical protein BC939DRAFT_456318 [Gamsiella multidivaricata]